MLSAIVNKLKKFEYSVTILSKALVALFCILTSMEIYQYINNLGSKLEYLFFH